jgi:DNA-binding NarL/FixJ family response regulator
MMPLDAPASETRSVVTATAAMSRLHEHILYVDDKESLVALGTIRLRPCPPAPRHPPRFLVLLTSGFVRSEDQKAAEDLGVRHIILKPSTLDVLADAIHSPTPSPKPNTFLTGSNLSIILRCG